MKPPNKYSTIWIILLILIIGILYFQNSGGEVKEYISLNQCFVYAPRIPYFPTTYVLGTLVDETLYRIIDCESDFRPDVCSFAGCESGQGLAQLIPSTVRYCEEKLDKEIDPFDPEDNIECAQWLLENEGDQHWKQSQECWDK